MTRIFILLAMFGAYSGPAFAEMRMGVPAYWGLTHDAYDGLTETSLAAINPSSGIINYTADTLEIAPTASDYGVIISDLQARGVHVQGYVPTGYFNHECDRMGECQTWERIVTQIHAYFELYPDLDGIFFDEAAAYDKTCDDYRTEYSYLRGLVRRYSQTASITFNPGMSDPCPIRAAAAGEIILTFEGDPEHFAENEQALSDAAVLAAERGVLTWHLLYDLADEDELGAVIDQSEALGATYFYATEIGGDWRAGDNTWGAPAEHWSVQAELLRK